MNDQIIRDLVFKAGAKLYSEPPMRQVTGVSMSFESVEKFAELIVKECIDICKDVNRNPYLEDEYQARQIIKNIEKHFGVE